MARRFDTLRVAGLNGRLLSAAPPISGAGWLRDTIAAAASDGDTIEFDAALNGQTITLTSDELAIDKDILISGPGPGLLTVAKSPSKPPPYITIFHVTPGRTVIHCYNKRHHHKPRLLRGIFNDLK